MLKGEKPADLPVQAPLKYETVNLDPAARGRGDRVGVKLFDAVQLDNQGDDRNGSTAVRLRLSTSLPVYPQQRTLRGHC
jgi:hypothetical protein